MKLAELLDAEPRFAMLPPRERIVLLAWFLHTHRAVDLLSANVIRECFRELNIASPDLSVYLPRMASTTPIQLLRDRGGFRLEGTLRRKLDVEYGKHPSVVRVQKLLSDLPDKIPNIDERVFLQETLNCYRVQAYRASIVMAWNLAFDHVLRWILNDVARLAKFNGTIVVKYPKRHGIAVVKFEDFSEEFKEAEIIEICRTANLLSKDQIEILREKLKKRNTAAHPSTVVVSQPQADDAISDLVNNVVLALP